MHWFITGGLGFVGLNLINMIFNKFKPRDIEITIFDSLKESKKKDLGYLYRYNSKILKNRRKINFVQGDIRNLKKIIKYSSNVNYFINLAANTGVQPSIINPTNDADININGNLNCLLAFEKITKKNKKFIFASSGAPIGDNIPPFHENSPTDPVSPYGISKLSCEKYVEYFNKLKNLNCAALRFSNLYGPLSLRKMSVISRMIKSIRDTKKITIYGKGHQTRDFLNVEDLCSAIIKTCTYDKKLKPLYQLGSGKETSINAISKMIKKNYSYEIKTIYKDKLLGDVERNYTNPNLFKKTFDWTPKKKLDVGIKQVVKWFDVNYLN
jgi:UDP-glucose 4-epimerase